MFLIQEKVFTGLADIRDIFILVVKLLDLMQHNLVLLFQFGIQLRSQLSLVANYLEEILHHKLFCLEGLLQQNLLMSQIGLLHLEILQKQKKQKEFSNGEVTIVKEVVMFGLQTTKNIKIILSHFHLMEKFTQLGL